MSKLNGGLDYHISEKIKYNLIIVRLKRKWNLFKDKADRRSIETLFVIVHFSGSSLLTNMEGIKTTGGKHFLKEEAL